MSLFIFIWRPLLCAAMALASVCQFSATVLAQTTAKVEVYVVQQRVVCGGHVYTETCPSLTRDDFNNLKFNHSIPQKPEQTTEVRVLSAPASFRFDNDLVGDAGQYLLHLNNYQSGEKKAALVVVYWKNPVPHTVIITRIERSSGKKICRPDPKTKEPICDYKRTPKDFFVYHYAFELVSSADLQIETRQPNARFGFGP